MVGKLLSKRRSSRYANDRRGTGSAGLEITTKLQHQNQNQTRKFLKLNIEPL